MKKVLKRNAGIDGGNVGEKRKILKIRKATGTFGTVFSLWRKKGTRNNIGEVLPWRHCRKSKRKAVSNEIMTGRYSARLDCPKVARKNEEAVVFRRFDEI
ncbi:unnamed protein product [Cylicocyclus nassatus]|uniref:Uncharacterized protein n=1 Tax=Cylicocyclus nassatus TaxID=53992 RepID=A0AA36GTP7_CYLNA|nr:unnamed protein product [Cylicocyclus nassatus]